MALAVDIVRTEHTHAKDGLSKTLTMDRLAHSDVSYLHTS